MNVDAYLQRIGYSGSRAVGAATLAALHEAHMRAVPFENLDIHSGRRIVLDPELLYAKVVTRRRGGFCYELNGLFAGLLHELGFSVRMVSARVRGTDGWGPPFDHMALLVDTGGTWLVDVGFGDSFRRPLPLAAGPVHHQLGVDYQLQHSDENWTLLARPPDPPDGDWQPQYRFDEAPHTLAEYEPMCHHHQSSPESSFTQKRVCTLATVDGRVTLSELRLIETSPSGRRERTLASETEVTAALHDVFGVTID